jgi:hypothetical protein
VRVALEALRGEKTAAELATVSYSLSDLGPLTNGLSRR